MNLKSYKKIVITGGSCAGKSQTVKQVRNYFSNQGYNVYILNEIPTYLMQKGITSETIQKMEFMKLAIGTQIELEKNFEQAISLSKNEKNILILDTSPIDSLKFINLDEFEQFAKIFKTSFRQILASYDVVIHLEAVAKKFPNLYSNETNKLRNKNSEISVERDERLLKAYEEHPNRVVIECFEVFEDKIRKVIDEIQKNL